MEMGLMQRRKTTFNPSALMKPGSHIENHSNTASIEVITNCVCMLNFNITYSNIARRIKVAKSTYESERAERSISGAVLQSERVWIPGSK